MYSQKMRLLCLNLALVMLFTLVPVQAVGTGADTAAGTEEAGEGYIFVDGIRYDATENHQGNGWTYTVNLGGTNQLALRNYQGGGIETDLDLQLLLQEDNVISGSVSAANLYISTIGQRDGIDCTVTITSDSGAALSAAGDISVGINDTILSVTGAQGSAAISAGRAISIVMQCGGNEKLEALGGGVPALSAVSISKDDYKGYLVKAGADKDSAAEVEDYAGQQYVSYEIRTKSLTLHGNGGKTSDDQEVYAIRTKELRVQLWDYTDVFSNDGKMLLGWSRNPDAQTIDFDINQNTYYSFDGEASAELYAVWESDTVKGIVMREYGQLSYVEQANYQSYVFAERMTVAVNAGTQYTLPESYKAGYAFKGWRSQEDGELYDAGTIISVDRSREYTAEYEVLTMMIDGRTYSMDSPHGSVNLGWTYQPDGQDGYYSGNASIWVYGGYSGKPISVPSNAYLNIAGSISGADGQPAVQIGGNAWLYFGSTQEATVLRGGSGASGISAAGYLNLGGYTDNSALVVEGSDGQPALEAKRVIITRAVLAGHTENDADFIGDYSGEEYIRINIPATVTVAPGQALPTPPSTDRYTFTAWRPILNGEVVKDVWYRGGDINDKDDTVTFVEDYKPAGTVIFDGNGGTTESGSKYYIEERVSGGNLILRDQSAATMFQRDGYTISGYSDHADGSGKTYAVEDFSTTIIWDYIVEKVKTVFAQWKKNTPDTPEQPGEPTVPAVPSQPAAPDESADHGLPFADVPESAYYRGAVAWAVANGITKGQSETVFAPDKICTRAEMVTFLWRAKGSPKPTTADNPFTDILPESYYYDAVLWALENNITTGTSETAFSPNDTVSRSEAVTFLWRCAGKPAAEGMLFADVDDGKYYAEAVRWATAGGITNGTGDGAFAPDTKCNRAQIVTFLYRSRE